jgi:RHS repeat-associated protein
MLYPIRAERKQNHKSKILALLYVLTFPVLTFAVSADDCPLPQTVAPKWAYSIDSYFHGNRYFAPQSPQSYPDVAPPACTAFQDNWNESVKAGRPFYQNSAWVWNGNYDPPIGGSIYTGGPEYPGYTKSGFNWGLECYGTFWQWTGNYTCLNQSGCSGCTRYAGESYVAPYGASCTTVTPVTNDRRGAASLHGYCPNGYVYQGGSSLLNARCVLQSPSQVTNPPESLCTLRQEKNSCTSDSMVNNPCNASNGNKYQSETDISSAALTFTRFYNSQLNKNLGLGYGWTASLSRRLEISSTIVQVREATGRGEPFTCPASVGACVGDSDTQIALNKTSTGYTLTRRNGTVERYNATGQVLAETDSSGKVTSYVYSGPKLSAVIYPNGHQLGVTFNGNRLMSITDGTGTIGYTYDANNNLIKVTYPSGEATLYHYENSSFPHHLTGISYQESNGHITRYSTYAYDPSGKAVLTEHAGGTHRATLQFNSPNQTTIRDAANTATVMTFATNLGIKNLVSKVNQADGKSLTQTFDVNNNLTCRKDEEGRVTRYTYNSANQKTSETVGLLGSCASPITTAATRTTTYQYVSPTLNTPTVIERPSAAPGQVKRDTFTYGDARFPTLPTAITQSGYTPSGTPVSRSVLLSYNAAGQVIAIDGPRTDVNDITQLSYYSCATGGHCGQLQSVTNALGHVTTYDAYDANGRLTQLTDPNGVRTNYTYDLRGRVQVITVTPPTGTGARVTRYTYNAASNVTSVTFPDGIVLTYDYDAAQKLRSVIDNLGNRVAYNYDLKGNRTEEATYDPNGSLVRAVGIAYDLRNRVSAINNGGSITQHVSDALGNLLEETAPNDVGSGSGRKITHNYDALNRLFETVNAMSGVTSYAYDGSDRLREVRAPNNATTTYVYDDLGNLLAEQSADRGTTTYTYDAAGNVTTVTDARGVVTQYQYDALNRVLVVDYPGTNEDITFTYDSGVSCTYGIGRLCAVQDESGLTHYAFDPFGNIVEQKKTDAGVTYTTQYTYDAGDRVLTITYPDNRLVTYTRDALGRVTAVGTTINGSQAQLIAGRTYRADGNFLSQTFGNGVNEVRDYNLKGELTYQSLGSIDTRLYQYDANGNLIQKQSLPEVGAYTYDALDRLIETRRDGGTDPYQYDPNGNRLRDAGGSYVYTANSNRAQTTPRGAVTLDAAGNTLSDGTNTYTYNATGQLAQARRSGIVVGSYTYNYLRQRTRKVLATTITSITCPPTVETKVQQLSDKHDRQLDKLDAKRNTKNAERIDQRIEQRQQRYDERVERLNTQCSDSGIGIVSTETVYHYDQSGNLLLETTREGQPMRSYVYVDSIPIAQIDRQPLGLETVAYLHTDPLGTPRLATNASAQRIWSWEGEAFGNTAPSGTVIVNLRYAGQYYDGETGLLYNWNRYYDPKLGRYITSDPIGLGGGPNTFAYVDNNPLRWTDPTGLKKVCRYVIGNFYWKDVRVKVQDEMGYYDTTCVPIPQPGPGMPTPTRRTGARGAMGALTDLFDPGNMKRECRTRWIRTQEEKWETQRQMWVYHWIACTDTCTGETTREWLPDQRASDPMPFINND